MIICNTKIKTLIPETIIIYNTKIKTLIPDIQWLGEKCTEKKNKNLDLKKEQIEETLSFKTAVLKAFTVSVEESADTECL